MKYTILTIIVLSTALFIASCDKKNDTSNQQSADKQAAGQIEETVVYYTCPMETHKDVHSDKQGKCPKCNMNLVAGVITSEEKMEYYGCPMEAHSHVRTNVPGTCVECGMKLKPMRLEK